MADANEVALGYGVLVVTKKYSTKAEEEGVSGVQVGEKILRAAGLLDDPLLAYRVDKTRGTITIERAKEVT